MLAELGLESSQTISDGCTRSKCHKKLLFMHNCRCFAELDGLESCAVFRLSTGCNAMCSILARMPCHAGARTAHIAITPAHAATHCKVDSVSAAAPPAMRSNSHVASTHICRQFDPPSSSSFALFAARCPRRRSLAVVASKVTLSASLNSSASGSAASPPPSSFRSCA